MTPRNRAKEGCGLTRGSDPPTRLTNTPGAEVAVPTEAVDRIAVTLSAVRRTLALELAELCYDETAVAGANGGWVEVLAGHDAAAGEVFRQVDNAHIGRGWGADSPDDRRRLGRLGMGHHRRRASWHMLVEL